MACDRGEIGLEEGGDDQEYRAAPSAAALIEAMRDIGYSLETALADIIDNAITAGASRIDLLHDTSASEPYIAIVDNGHGMDRAELLDAMRPGSRNPLHTRRAEDLGRFGLGLKTASFSQCRSLTVVARSKGETTAARWDLDLVAKRDDWLLQLPPAFEPETLPGVDRLGQSGVVVIWQKLDRIADGAVAAALPDHLLDRLDSARRHLELVFHRFLQGGRGVPKIGMYINGRALTAFDPFNSTAKATQRLPEETIRIDNAEVKVQPWVLPHHGKVSPADWEKYGGEGGYLKNQGFYLYRGGRLIIHGTWFRLARQSELTKLARVQIDMPNGLDAHWKIDVRKASAQPPYVVRQRLKSIIDAIAEPSRRVYTARGARLTAESQAVLWRRRADKGRITYEINRDHPLLSEMADALPDDRRADLETLLRGIESAFPVDAMFSDAAFDPTSVGQAALPDDELSQLLEMTVRAMAGRGIALDVIVRDLSLADPYRSNWKVAEPMIGVIHARLMEAHD